MQPIKDFLHRHPVVSVTTLMLTVLVVLVLIPKTLLSGETALETFRLAVRYSISLLLILFMLRAGWLRDAHISTPPSRWHKRWWLAMLPMCLIGLINLTNVDWELVEFTLTATSLWLADNLAVGIFEEMLLRGVCFYILYRAWRETPSAYLKAGLAQGLIFGIVHFVNVPDAGLLLTSIQVVYATLLGVGFAGLVVFTRSIWPGVFIHFFIDLMGSFEMLMANPPAESDPSLAGYAVAIVIIALLSTLPGFIYLRKADKARAAKA